MTEIQDWLRSHHSDGVNLSIPELLYYRNKHSLLSLQPRRSVQAKMAGGYLAKTKGRGMEFDEARHYQPGDDIRAIDWRVTARTGKTHTKLFREEKERPVFILTDLSASQYFGTQLLFKSVQAAHLTSLLAWSAKQRGDRVGALLFNQFRHLEYKPLSRQKAVLSILHGLMELHQPAAHLNVDTGASKITLADSCARLRRLAHPGSLICLVSDFQQLDDTTAQHLGQLSRHCEVKAFPISDPFEHSLPKVKGARQLAVTDGVETRQLILGDKRAEQQYQSQHEAFFAQLNDKLKHNRIDVLPISAGLPLETQLQQVRRGVMG